MRSDLPSVIRARTGLLSRGALAAAQVSVIAWFSPGPGLPLDDAWIHQDVARVLARTGTLGYAPGEHGAAATSYLWAALLALGLKLRLLEPTRWALVLNVAAALASGQLLYAIVRGARPRDAAPGVWSVTAFAATALAVLSPNLLWFACSGMEAMPFVALSLAAVWAVGTEEESPRRALFGGVTAGAAALMRPEAIALGALLVAHAALRGRRKTASRLALPWLACVGVYVGSNLAKTGHALPSTLSGRRWLWFSMSGGLSRLDRVLDFFDAWITRLGTYTVDASAAGTLALVGLAAFGALRLARGDGWNLRGRANAQDAPKLLVLWALSHAAFYALLLPTPGHGGRYQPLTPTLFALALPLGVVFVLRDLARVAGYEGRFGLARCAAVGLAPWGVLGAPVAVQLKEANALAVAHIHNTELGAGAFVDTLPDGAVASFDIGGVGWVARRPILDLGGLSDPKTAALIASGRASTWLEEHHVKWIVLPQSYEHALPTFEDYRFRLHLEGNPALRLRPIRVFETPFAQWEPSIRATWNAAPKQVVFEVTYTGAPGPREVPLPPAGARRAIADPASMVPTNERVVAENMLATLEAWGLPLDVTVAPAPPSTAADAHGPGGSRGERCALTLGWWGIAVERCDAVDDVLLRATAHEMAGRYLDVGDLGGALRSLPHAAADARRHIDPRFHPPLAPLAPPVPGGVDTGAMHAGRYGLAVLAAVLLAAIALDIASRRGARVSSVRAWLNKRAAAAPAAALAVALVPIACGGPPDVSEAMRRGRGGVEIAIARGGDVSRAAGRAPLLEAAAIGDAEIVSLLLAHGAKRGARDGDGASALHLAARGSHHAALAVLLTSPAPDRAAELAVTAGARRRTALQDAAAVGSVESVRALLDAGAEPNAADSFGQTALHVASGAEPARAAEIVALLLARGADASLVDARGFTPLHAGGAAGASAFVRALAAKTELLEKTTPAGETALDVALRYGRDLAAEALVAAGATFTRDDQWPPLHEAARTDAVERAAALVAGGADTARRVRELSALDVAARNGSARVEALLRGRAP
jgi:ankyrin repeat protein